MQRILLVMLLVLAAVAMEQMISLGLTSATPQATPVATVVPTATATTEPDKYVFCQSIIHVVLPRNRTVAYIQHPPGGREVITAMLRRLDYEGIPPKPWGDESWLEDYQIVRAVCFESWVQVFEITNQLSLGAATRKLEDPYAITEHDMRRATLKVYFKDQWQTAEALFSRHGE